MKKCNICGFLNDSDAKYCASCGKQITDNGDTASLIIGRDSSCGLVIKSGHVSSRHARIDVSGGRYEITDLGSSNGTFVNGIRLSGTAAVKPGDKIGLSKGYELTWDHILGALNGGLKENISTVQAAGNNEAGSVDISLHKEVVTIGRSSDNDIVLDNIKVSRRHARITTKNGVSVLEDLDSSNGTWVNGKKVKTAVISETDKIFIGGIPLSLRSLLEENPVNLDALRLTLRNLSFTVAGSGSGKTIVDDISLTINPGEFVGLIGPSGAGKTSLMLMMAGVARPPSGGVFLNEESLYSNPELFKGQTGYVPQDDIIHRELLVRESLEYTARLRFGSKLSQTDVTEQVKNVLTKLDLVNEADVRIGSPENKGISGGQRKRVNLGQELLTEPSILFLDEPTSGLDPKTDLDVMNMLKRITGRGKSVVLTTHSITEENFSILTHIIILTKGGKLAYFGPSSEAAGYFGVKKPYEIFDKLKEHDPGYWKEKYRRSEYYNRYVSGRDNGLNTTLNIRKKPADNKIFDFTQTLTLISRFFKVKVRDTVSTAILLAQAPFIAVLMALIFSGDGNDKLSALFLSVIASIWLGCSNAARDIVSEQSVYKRERMVNLGILSYLGSKYAVLSLLSLIQSILLSSVIQPATGLDISWGLFTLLLFLISAAAMSMSLLISALVKTPEAAMSVIPIVLIPQVILGGLIKYFRDMNGFAEFLSWLMLSRWGFEAVLNGEDNFLYYELTGAKAESLGGDIAALAAFFIVFFAATALALKRKDV
ncbi:MAG: FHA domain-containing protein [Ignavibacteriaceae bacterium]|nr:FHA domain-containing protein [Ignavibacteriaceae bacterium]